MSTSRRPPKRIDSGVMRLLKELSERPAMNGGFQKLAQQQTEQLDFLQKNDADMKKMEPRLAKVESDMDSIHKAGKWVVRLLSAVLVGVLVELVLRLASHVQLVAH